MLTRSRAIGLNTPGFILVTLAAYLSALVSMSYVLNAISARRATVLITLAIIYVVNGVKGYSWARNTPSGRRLLVYFGTQIILAGTLLVLTRSPAIIIAMLPLASQSVVLLAPRLVFLTCLAMMLSLVVPIAIFGGWGPALVLGMFLLAGIVFVVVITRLAVKEQRARAEVERLLAELKEANDQLRRYAEQVEEVATLKERNRLAREIHDSLGHYLTVVIMQLEAAMALVDTDREKSVDGLRKAQALAQKGLADVRHSVAALRASPAEASSLVDLLNALFEECRVSGVNPEFCILGTPRKLSASAELTLYRAAQEGLTNVRKHSHVETATVTLDYADETVRLVVHDDGVGSSKAENGFGLVGVKERVQLLGGAVTIRTGVSQGFTLEVGLRE